jgi:hypothetical protein
MEISPALTWCAYVSALGGRIDVAARIGDRGWKVG